MSYLLLGIGLIAIASLLVLVIGSFLLVEDWSRDLSQNHAETEAEHRDLRLRPVVSSDSPEVLAQRVREALASLPGWKFESEERSDGQLVLRLTRTTRLWRFVDDITVRIGPRDSGSVLHAESRSRVGKGDLGQNPRNLRELLDKLRDRSS